MSHTKGPWRIDDGYPSVIVLGENNVTICEIYTRANDDRHLIAAAPDMLAACEKMLALLIRYENKSIAPEVGTGAAIDAATAAIAKARGQ